MSADDLRRLYEERTGQAWTPDAGGQWLRKNHALFELELFTKPPVLGKTAHIDLSDKAIWLSQLWCCVCNPVGTINTFPLRILPQSYQSLDSVDKAAFKAAIALRLKKSPHIEKQAGRICLSFLFICRESRRVKDLDNMAKLLMDSLKGLVMGDDKDVDHLSILRLAHDGDEEFVYVRISSSSLNNHEDVADLSMKHSWGGAEALQLEDFRVQPGVVEE